jgi:hypothetical protein
VKEVKKTKNKKSNQQQPQHLEDYTTNEWDWAFSVKQPKERESSREFERVRERVRESSREFEREREGEKKKKKKKKEDAIRRNMASSGDTYENTCRLLEKWISCCPSLESVESRLPSSM